MAICGQTVKVVPSCLQATITPSSKWDITRGQGRPRSVGVQRTSRCISKSDKREGRTEVRGEIVNSGFALNEKEKWKKGYWTRESSVAFRWKYGRRWRFFPCFILKIVNSFGFFLISIDYFFGFFNFLTNYLFGLFFLLSLHHEIWRESQWQKTCIWKRMNYVLRTNHWSVS